MKLYFVRHASAASRSTWTDDDGLRPLTHSGSQRFSAACAALARAGVLRPDLILTSPLVRARQTADLLAEAVAGAPTLAEDDRLALGFDTTALLTLLAEHPDERSIAIVGHNPNLCEVLSEFVGGADLGLRKGSIALVEMDGPAATAGTLVWLTPPSVFSAGS